MKQTDIELEAIHYRQTVEEIWIATDRLIYLSLNNLELNMEPLLLAIQKLPAMGSTALKRSERPLVKKISRLNRLIAEFSNKGRK